MVKTRRLSDSFMSDLKNKNGKLHSLLKRILEDDTLMMSIRADYINIYYRGGNLLRVTKNDNSTYLAFFDQNYNKSGVVLPTPPSIIHQSEHLDEWIAAFPVLRGVMDNYLSKHDKTEREFQQLIARENNCSSISNETEYFITDIELSDSELGARFDLLAIRWPASERKSGRNCRVALIELKYGDDALGGTAGLLKHLKDLDQFLSNEKSYGSLRETMESQFNQLDQLNLFHFNRAAGYKVKLNPEPKPEVIFVLANHNPRSTKLVSILNDPQIRVYEKSQLFDLRFFVSTFAGYGLHTDCMLSLEDFRKQLSRIL